MSLENARPLISANFHEINKFSPIIEIFMVNDPPAPSDTIMLIGEVSGDNNRDYSA